MGRVSLAVPVKESPESRAIRLEVLHDLAKAAGDLAVDRAGRTRGEGRGKVRKKCFEAQALGEASLGAAALLALHEQQHDERGLQHDHARCPKDIRTIALP